MQLPLVLLGVTLLSLHSSATIFAEEKPNVLILYADDLGIGDLTCYNPSSKIPTPHLDELAREGMRFTDGHSSSGICTPSRYALLTGRHHWRAFHGIVNTLEPSVFEADRLTLPEMMQGQGYETACIGKWHLGWNWAALRKPETAPKSSDFQDFDWSKRIPDGPLAHGFDHYFGDTVINFPPYCWIEDDRVTEAPNANLTEKTISQKTKEGNWEVRPGPALADWDFYQVLPTLADRGVEYLRNRRDQEKPFFLYFAFPCPHAPIIPNDEFDGSSQAGPYGDFVVQTDDICGRLIAALKASGHYENTIILFSADNGPEYYAYARAEKYQHWSAEPQRGLKRDLYEGGHRVPFLIKWPGVTEAGTVSDALVSQIDYMATLAGELGVELSEKDAEDSHNLLPLLAGTTPQVRESHIHNTFPNQYAIRMGDWLYIDAKSGYAGGKRRNKAWEKERGYPADDDQPVQLFNLKQDIAQKVNLAAEQPERVKAMKAELTRLREQGHSAPRLAK